MSSTHRTSSVPVLRWAGQPPGLYVIAGALTGLGAVLLGNLTAGHRFLAIAAAVVALGAALALREPLVVPIGALLAVFVAQRIGGASTSAGSSGGISYADLLLAGASLLAWPLLVGNPALRRLRLPLIGVAAYLALLMPTVVLNHATRGDLEWAHRLVMLGGSLLVGAWIAQAGGIRPALQLFIHLAAAIAVIAFLDGARHGFSHPAGPLGWNKNFLGDLLADALVLAFCLGRHLGLRRSHHWILVAVITAGLAATQSRGGMLAAAIALTATALIETRNRRLRAVVIVLAIGLVAAVGLSVRDDFNQSAQSFNLNSIGTRFNVEHETQRIWETSPTAGVGLKYFNTGLYGPYAQPANNAVDNELAESGVAGLLGFVLLQGFSLAPGYRRRRDLFVVVAASTVLAHLVHGMVDIYWIAGESALPFVLLGMALAERPSEDAGATHGD